MIWPENDLATSLLGLLAFEEPEHAEEVRHADGGVPTVLGLLAKKEV